MSEKMRQACIRTFLMEPHQVRYMLETFRNQTIAEAFLLHLPEVSWWRRRLGIAPMKPGFPVGNGARGVSKYFPAFAA